MASSVAITACGGGAALMHPAHTLPEGRYSVGAGVSNQFVVGPAADAIDRAEALPGAAVNLDPGSQERLALGAVSRAAFGPGVAPWVGARAGLGSDVDMGLTYTGRSARADARWALQGSRFALSIGGGVSAIAAYPSRSATVVTTYMSRSPEIEVGRVRGWGVDVPLLLGVRSDASLIQAWFGPRVGFERVSGDLQFHTSGGAFDARSDPWQVTRWYAGGLLGLAVGIHPIWAVMELDASYQSISSLESATVVRISGQDPTSSDLRGVTLVPTGALLLRF